VGRNQQVQGRRVTVGGCSIIAVWPLFGWRFIFTPIDKSERILNTESMPGVNLRTFHAY
jgi:hypothetical protein